jgi:ApaG protein
MYSKTTDNINITVIPNYMREFSSPLNHKYVWAYTVYIKNSSTSPIHLLSRYWKVIDGDGFMQEVEGEGVVGQQPIIPARGGKFEYTSQVHLTSSSGIMMGYYTVIIQKTGEAVEIPVPAFSLDFPDSDIVIN